MQAAVPGSTIELSPTRPVQVFNAPVRVNAALWLYDEQSGVLFTSDSFGHVHLAQADDPFIVDEAHDRTTEDDLRRHLLTKFDWLVDADTTETLAALRGLFEQVTVAGIAPGRGCILMGRALVARHLELFSAVLRGIQSRAPYSVTAPSGGT
jgi:flavorubredoxin